MDSVEDTDETVPFGKHRGERWTRVPVSYLRWMVNLEPPHSHRDTAQAELDRRGTTLDHPVEVSGHAIDRMSQRRMHCWEKHRLVTEKGYEGLHAFLVRVSAEALEKVEPRGDSKQKYKYLGMTLAIDSSMAVPVLKSVM